MMHMIVPSIMNLHGRYSRDRKPILTVDSGDTILARTRCCGWGFEPPPAIDVIPSIIPRAERADPENDEGLCLLGPIAVKGAKPGMTLEVDIEELRVGAYGLTVTGGEENQRYDKLGLDASFAWMPWRFDEAGEVARNARGLAVRIRPFLGSLGVAQDLPGYHSNLLARNVGGNIDCKELTPGSKLYLPIEVPEAQFSFGDGHAVQGDGELCDSAIECPMDEVKLTLTIRNDVVTKWPLAYTPDAWITFGFAEDLNDAMFIATNNMLDLMMSKHSMTRKEAVMLASLVVDLRITQIANPTVGVHAILPHGSFA